MCATVTEYCEGCLLTFLYKKDARILFGKRELFLFFVESLLLLFSFFLQQHGSMVLFMSNKIYLGHWTYTGPKYEKLHTE